MPRAKKARKRKPLPDWAKHPEKYQYEKAKVHTVDVRPKVIKGISKYHGRTKEQAIIDVTKGK